MRIASLLGVAAAIACTGCQEERQATEESFSAPVAEVSGARDGAAGDDADSQVEARATLRSPNGEEMGSVRLSQDDGQVVLAGDLRRLEPGQHGLHIHEVGDCSAPDFSSAGEHFAPLERPHGGPSDTDRHAGDFGNVEVSEVGTASFRTTSDRITLQEGPASVIGRAVVVHAGRDDLETQPSGDSGSRIACGVIELEG